MGTYNLREWTTNVMAKRKAKLKNLKAAKKAADYLVANAIMLAPNYSGQTKMGIRARKYNKTGMKVESFVPGRFKQNMWANKTPPFRNPKIRWNKFKKTIYGSVSKTSKGNPVKWTGYRGRRGFFDEATSRTKKKFKKMVVTELHKAMRS